MATNYVPHLVEVKAKSISVGKDAYNNRQPQYNAAYDELSKAVVKMGDSAILAKQRSSANIKAEKVAAANLQKTSASNYVTQGLEVGNLTNTGNAQFDKNKFDFFLEQTQMFAAIQQRILEKPETAQQGSMELAKIRNLVTQYTEAAPDILKNIVFLQDVVKKRRGTEGSLSSEVPDNMQRMLLSMGGTGGANVSLINDNGQLTLFSPYQEYTENGETIVMQPSAINIAKFKQLSKDANGGVLATVPKWSEEIADLTKGYSDLGATEDGVNPMYTTTETITNKDNGDVTEKRSWNNKMTNAEGDPVVGEDMIMIEGMGGMKIKNPYAGMELNGEQALEIHLIQAGTYNEWLNSQNPDEQASMNSVWIDVIPDATNPETGKLIDELDDGVPGNNTQFDVDDPEKVGEAAFFFAKSGLEKYQKGLGIQQATQSTSGLTASDLLKMTNEAKTNEQVNTAVYDLYNNIKGVAGNEKSLNSLFSNTTIGTDNIQGVKLLTTNELLGTSSGEGGGKSTTIQLITGQPTYTQEQVYKQTEGSLGAADITNPIFEEISAGADGNARFIKKTIDMEKSGKDMRILYDLKGTDKQSEAQQDAVRNLFKKLKIEEAERAKATKWINEN